MARIGTGLARLAVGVVLGCIATVPPAIAHEGHSHGEPKLPKITNVAPRAEAQSEELEVLAVAAEGQLIVFLDHYVGNQPVTGADLEVIGDDEFELPVEQEPGVYVVPWDPAPGSHELTVTVLAGDIGDFMMLTIDIPEVEAEGTGALGLGVEIGAGVGWMLAAGIFLMGMAVALILAGRAKRLRIAMAVVALLAIVGSILGTASAREAARHDDGARPAPGTTIPE